MGWPDPTHRRKETTEALGGSMPVAGIAGKRPRLSNAWRRGRSADGGRNWRKAAFDCISGKHGLAGIAELAGWMQAVAWHGKTERKGSSESENSSGNHE